MRVKNQSVYDAILNSATREFTENGYLKSTIGKIASRAGTAPSNIYVYFQSKLEIALAVYEPWFKSQILDLEREVSQQESPSDKVRRLLKGLWEEIPRHKDGLTTTLVQALSAATPRDHYNPDLLNWAEQRIAEMLSRAVTGSGNQKDRFMPVAHMIMLAFDGVGLRHNLSRPVDHREDMIRETTRMICQMSAATPG